jgi:tight adherence protein B
LNSLWIIYFVVFAAVMLGIQAIYLVFFRLRATRKSINRRLALNTELSGTAAVLDTLRRERGFSGLENPTLQRLNDLLMQTGLKLNRPLLILSVPALSVFLFLGLGVAMGYGVLSFILSVLIATLMVVLFLWRARRRRLARFAEQFPDALDITVRGVRAGHPFPMALGLVAREMPDPIGSEFGMTFDEISFGMDVRKAVENLYRRAGQEDLLFFVIAINIQTQTGGNLAEVLQRLSRMIRARSKFRLKVRALSAEGRASALALTLMPFILFGIISFISPPYFGAVRHNPLFMPAVFFALTLLLIANIILYRMVNAKY